MFKGGIGNIMKQAQQMQANMEKVQKEIAEMEITGQAGGGMVSITINGKHEARRVSIDESLMSDDKDMLEDLIAAAINDAAHKLEAQSKAKMEAVTAGMPLPPGMKMPF